MEQGERVPIYIDPLFKQYQLEKTHRIINDIDVRVKWIIILRPALVDICIKCLNNSAFVP